VEAASLMSSTVLVVDDDPAIRAVLADVLTFEGYDVLTAGNGQEALQRIASRQPDVVLLDMRMPVMDGWEFAHALQDRGLRLPICVMTAESDPGSWASAVGADAFIGKPFDVTQLLFAIEALCREHNGDG
jgi:CheY-like chemotaxis protein